MPHSVAEKETNNYTWGTVCFFFFLYACDASIRKLLSSPSTTTTKKNNRAMCVQSPVSQSPQRRSGHLSGFACSDWNGWFYRHSPGRWNFEPSSVEASAASRLGKCPKLGSFSPPGFFPSSQPSCTWATSLTRREPRAETKAWRLGPPRRWTRCRSS